MRNIEGDSLRDACGGVVDLDGFVLITEGRRGCLGADWDRDLKYGGSGGSVAGVAEGGD